MSAPGLSNPEKDALAERMADALHKLAVGLPAADVALAVMRATGALLRACAAPGYEADMLAQCTRYFEYEINTVRSGHAPPRRRQH